MKIICQKEVLLNAVSIASKAVSYKKNMEILECILLIAKSNELTLIANDTEMGIETIVNEGIEIDEAGMIAVNARMLNDVIRKMPEGDIEIYSDEATYVSFKSGDIVFDKIPAHGGETFTLLPNVNYNYNFKIYALTLKDMIRQTIFSVAGEEANRMMTGELFEIKNDHLRIVSLDGHRVALRQVTLREHNDNRKVIIPARTLGEISKIIGDDPEEEIWTSISDNHIMFKYGQTRIVSLLIDGDYYEIDALMTTDYSTRVVVNKQSLLECIDRSTLLVRDTDRKPVVFEIMDHVMKLQLKSEFGSMNEPLPVEKEGKDLMIAFNPQFFIDALRVIPDEEVILYMTNPKYPCFIRDNSDSYIYLILPVNF